MILNQPIENTSFCVIDLETSGFSKDLSEIVEIAVWRREPESPWRCIFDTLIRPRQSITNSAIHGIQDRDVKNAPRFIDVIPALLNALSQAVLVAHNVYFDLPFLLTALHNSGQHLLEPPHLCSIYLRRMAGFPVPEKTRHSLDWAARQHQISLVHAHQARDDAEVVTYLLDLYIPALLQQNPKMTWNDLARGYSYRFLDSWKLPFWNSPSKEELLRFPLEKLCPR